MQHREQFFAQHGHGHAHKDRAAVVLLSTAQNSDARQLGGDSVLKVSSLVTGLVAVEALVNTRGSGGRGQVHGCKYAHQSRLLCRGGEEGEGMVAGRGAGSK